MADGELRCGPNDDGKRVDRVLRRLFPQAGLGEIFALLRKGGVRVNGVPVQAGHRLREGDRIGISGPGPGSRAETGRRHGTPFPAAASSAEGSPIPPLVLWENDDFLVLNKPRGALVHGAGGLDGPVRRYLLPRIPPSLAFSPGPLHRLDRNTTGILFFAKSIRGARSFSQDLREGRARKTYLAILEGDLPGPVLWEDRLDRDGESRITRLRRETGGGRKAPPPENLPPPGSRATPPETRGEAPSADAPLPGKTARLQARPLLRSGTHCLCEILIHTGRTHQIRAQAAARGHPLAGDRKYGGKPFPGGYHLHAREYRLRGREGGPDPIQIRAPLPADFRAQAERLFGVPAVRALFPPGGP